MLEVIAIQSSLFEPVDALALEGAAEWATELVAGPLATSLSTIGLAIIGFIALSGRLSVRLLAKVVIGCFVLLGAPAIAVMLASSVHDTANDPVLLEVSPAYAAREFGLPPVNNNPYALATTAREGQ